MEILVYSSAEKTFADFSLSLDKLEILFASWYTQKEEFSTKF